jgi:hypothetical protein
LSAGSTNLSGSTKKQTAVLSDSSNHDGLVAAPVSMMQKIENSSSARSALDTSSLVMSVGTPADTCNLQQPSMLVGTFYGSRRRPTVKPSRYC